MNGRSYGGFRLSPTTPTRLDEGSSCAKRALVAENARNIELPNDFRLAFRLSFRLVPLYNNRLHKEHEKYLIGSTDDKEEAHNNPVEKAPTESDGITIGLIFGPILSESSRSSFYHVIELNSTSKKNTGRIRRCLVVIEDRGTLL